MKRMFITNVSKPMGMFRMKEYDGYRTYSCLCANGLGTSCDQIIKNYQEVPYEKVKQIITKHRQTKGANTCALLSKVNDTIMFSHLLDLPVGDEPGFSYNLNLETFNMETEQYTFDELAIIEAAFTYPDALHPLPPGVPKKLAGVMTYILIDCDLQITNEQTDHVNEYGDIVLASCRFYMTKVFSIKNEYNTIWVNY